MILFKKSTYTVFTYVLLVFLFQSCGSGEKKQEKQFSISIDGGSTRLSSGSILQLNVSATSEKQIDSVVAFIAGSRLTTDISSASQISIQLPNSLLGRHTISTSLFSGETSEHTSFQITIVSDIIPKQTQARVISMFNHDPEAYTQGLEYKNGYFYESTGLYGKSTIRKVEAKTGNVVLSKHIPETMFGEGLTIVGDSIFQLTWREQIGYIYTKKTLEKIGEFSYNTEGWGLCFDGEHLIMTDGSEYLYFHTLPPEFRRVKQIPVYDNNGPVRKLNELEYINGYVYANIYTTDYIVKIDPTTGKIHQRIDLSNILPVHFKHDAIDVLNGIAYDRKNNRIFVTGKNWPKLFEVEF